MVMLLWYKKTCHPGTASVTISFTCGCFQQRIKKKGAWHLINFSIIRYINFSYNANFPDEQFLTAKRYLIINLRDSQSTIS